MLVLKYRRLRGDMIEVFKITHEIYDGYDPDVSLKLVYHPNSNTRGNNTSYLTNHFTTTHENTVSLHV